jgi:hypothetical protein
MSEECDKLSREGADGGTIGKVYADAWRLMLLGDLDAAFVSVSDAVNCIESIETCKDVVDELAAAFV